MTNLIKYLAIVLITLSCSTTNKKEITEESFLKGYSKNDIKLFTLKNKNGIKIQITNYGGRVVSLYTPDKNGKFKDIVLGYDNINGYFTSNEVYYGCIIGRYANRIANGKFSLNNTEYTLAKNNDNNTLHGGLNGFNNMVWKPELIKNNKLKLTYTSKDMEEGYPGNLSSTVIYELTENNELKIDYNATTDKSTVVNMTHHSFFNLKGPGNGKITDHILQINADKYTPVDKNLIPTGELATVDNTPFDFRNPTLISNRINKENEQIKLGRGLDHNWVLNKNQKSVNFAAKIIEPVSGRSISVFTNEPGMQFYSGNFLNGKDKGKNGKIYAYRTAFCLETQHYPDSPNQVNFPSVVLNPGETYNSVCIYKFDVVKNK